MCSSTVTKTIFCWCGSISSDEGWLSYLLLGDFWELAKQICHRLSHTDMVKMVCNDVIKALLTPVS